jgi:type VI secretion system protein VasD
MTSTPTGNLAAPPAPLVWRYAGAVTLCAALAGCAGAAGSLASVAMELTGLKKPPPEQADALKPARNVALRLHAGASLNTTPSGQSLALVVRIYKLRQPGAFQQAPYDSFLSAAKEKELMGADLLEVKEVLLIPGQHYDSVEKVSREAYFIGVVALFRAPSEQRWRLAFNAADAEKTGITLGLHGCALSVGTGSASASTGAGLAPAGQSLSDVRCQ